MSTQHPDNVNPPFFAESTVLAGEDEIQEAYYAFSHLGCDEQMWDCEGKDVDSYVVTKLLSKYESFFRQRKLGQEVRITMRVPNPAVEKAEAKVLLETLEGIPRAFDVARLFYGEDIAPIFEVILPMTTSAEAVDRVYRYYADFVAGKQHKKLDRTTTVAQWIGQFRPERINVIPLFEDKPSILHAADTVERYLRDKKDMAYQRVFIARSDPALNYGNVSNVLLYKIAAQRLRKLSQRLKLPLPIILGVGGTPFRGNLRPHTVDRVLKEYPAVQTFTVQSSFKYDHAPDQVRAAIAKLQKHEAQPALAVDEKRCLVIIEKYSAAYQKQIRELAPTINAVAKYVPPRRKRKLHIGLFGYSRSLGEISLPRAITFTAALYSVGLPPELLALNALSPSDWKFLKKVYINFEADLRDALVYYNPDSPFVPRELVELLGKLARDVKPDEEHRVMTNQIIQALERNDAAALGDYVLRAASLRKFLG